MSVLTSFREPTLAASRSDVRTCQVPIARPRQHLDPSDEEDAASSRDPERAGMYSPDRHLDRSRMAACNRLAALENRRYAALCMFSSAPSYPPDDLTFPNQ